MNDKIKQARQQLGLFFKQRREQMGVSQDDLATHLGITANTVKGIETGRFAWDIDLQHRICAALEIKPYFSASEEPETVDYRNMREDDPERYHGFYITENLVLYPDQLAITKLTAPRLFVRFNYGDSYFSSYEDWVANHTELSWLDPADKPTESEEIESVLTDCWNFLAVHEREEERLYNNNEDEDDN